MAGSISLSLSQQFDSLGKPLSGGLLYTYAAGTTNPQSAYQDVALTIPWPNPITLDGAGRVPPFYLADGQIKIRLTDKLGILQVAADNLLVVGSSSGTGTPPSVDATTLIQTGMILPMYGVGPLTGFVRANARTIGNASSGATERANADTANLFAFLYQQDANLTVSGGRGASAAADYAANKTILLPDWRGRALAGLDDMGNTSAARMSPALGVSSTTLGGSGGAPNATLSQGHLPATTYSLNSGSVSVASTRSDIVVNTNGTFQTSPQGGPTTSFFLASAFNTGITSTGTATGTIGPLGSGSAFNTVSPVMLATIYLKL